jgi:hypothetical protein
MSKLSSFNCLSDYAFYENVQLSAEIVCSCEEFDINADDPERHSEYHLTEVWHDFSMQVVAPRNYEATDFLRDKRVEDFLTEHWREVMCKPSNANYANMELGDINDDERCVCASSSQRLHRGVTSEMLMRSVHSGNIAALCLQKFNPAKPLLVLVNQSFTVPASAVATVGATPILTADKKRRLSNEEQQ